jgi:hypothetical protein
MYANMGGSVGTPLISILYGRQGMLPDTNDVETIALDKVNGRDNLLSDVTGDGIPEILSEKGSEEKINIYAGAPGQRLIEQFGSGDDPPLPGKGRWRRPWAVLWTANRLDDGYTGSEFAGFHDLGDGNEDGVGDIWITSLPTILCYSGGTGLDSLIDGFMIAGVPTVRLGDIDGSGVTTIAVYDFYGRGIVFYKTSKDVPSWGADIRILPTSLSSVPMTSTPHEEGLKLEAIPNPAQASVEIRWNDVDKGEAVSLSVHDVLGRVVAHWRVPAGEQESHFSTDGLVGGVYFITLHTANCHVTTRVLIRP